MTTIDRQAIDRAAAAMEAMAAGKAADMPLSEYARQFMSGGSPGDGAPIGGPADPFRQSLWVNSCITAIVAPASRVPLRLSRGAAAGTRAVFGSPAVRWGRIADRQIRRDKGAELKAVDGEIVESGDLFSMLARPNPAQTWRQFLEQTIGLLYCCGRVHWVLADMIGRRPTAIAVVSGSDSRPLTTNGQTTGELLGWKLRVAGQWQDYTLDEVVTFQLFDPANPHGGLAPRVPANLAIISDFNASTYNAAMFGNSAEPGGAVEIPDPYDAVKDEQARAAWMQRHRGSGRAKTPAFLWGGAKWESIASTMAEMQFIEGKRLSREEICTAYRVPPAVAGFTGTTGDAAAYYQAELERFWQDTLAPLLDKLAEGVNVHLAPRFVGGLEAWFDADSVPTVQRMRRATLDAVDKLWGKGVPLSDLNELYDLGLPARPWHEQGFLAAGLLPAADVAAGNIFPAVPEGPGPDDGEPVEETGRPDPRVLGAETKAALDRIWSAFARSWAPLADSMRAMLRARMFAQQRRLLELLNAADQARGANVKTLDEGVIGRILIEVFGRAAEQTVFRARVRRFVADAQELGLRQALAEAGLAGEALDAALKRLMANPAIAAAINGQTLKISTLVDDRTRGRLRVELSEGLSGGEDVRALADRIQGVMQVRRNQAMTIARNSVGQALSRARHDGHRAAGMTHKVWVHSRGPGERRPEHVAAEAVYAAAPCPIDQPFVVNGVALMYPRDSEANAPGETINCQCLSIARRLTAEQAVAAGAGGGIVKAQLLSGFVTYGQMLAARQAA